MPYNPGYEEEGWLRDAGEARWAFVLVVLELASLLGVWVVVLATDRLVRSPSAILHGGRVDAPSSFGGLASILTIASGLAATIYASQQRSLARHRVRKLYDATLATAVAGLLVFVLIAVVTA